MKQNVRFFYINMLLYYPCLEFITKFKNQNNPFFPTKKRSINVETFQTAISRAVSTSHSACARARR